MTSERVRVLVVDDSAFARKVLREVLGASPLIEVVGFARDGLEALERIEELRPDVVTLDLIMPNLDGIGVLRALPAVNRPRVVVVSISDQDSALGVEALHLGAVDVVEKPTALATERLYELRGELLAKVIAAAGARQPRGPEDVPAPPPHAPQVRHATSLLVVGTSTGGPQALTRLLTSLPASFPVPIAMALHIPAGYTHSLAQRLDKACQLSVLEAEDGMVLRAGQAVLAPGGRHLRIERRGNELVTRVDAAGSPAGEGRLHAPSVSLLFETAAREVGRGVLAVVLTGMGDDGLEGARAVRAAGGTILTESEASCVVYGMPRCVWEAGLSSGKAPLERMAELIERHL
jgi:two-component system chemotaxis response regulator CheB